MKKFTKIIEKSSINRSYKTIANIEIIIDANNEGEAGYISDSILSSIENIYDYTIESIEETSDEINESSYDENLEIDDLKSRWISEFDDRLPTSQEKSKWYNKMRKEGFDGITIYKTMEELEK